MKKERKESFGWTLFGSCCLGGGPKNILMGLRKTDALAILKILRSKAYDGNFNRYDVRPTARVVEDNVIHYE